MSRSCLQFRLLHLVIAIPLTCVTTAYVTSLQRRADRQAKALHVVKMMGGTYDDVVVAPWHEWLAGGPVDRKVTVRFQRRAPGQPLWGPYGPENRNIALLNWVPDHFPNLSQALQQLRGMRELDFYSSRLRGHAEQLIPVSRQLAHLSLSEIGVRSSDLAALTRVPKLTHLSLRRTSAADEGLRYISHLSQLEWLDLSSTDVTDSGLQQLAVLKKLNTLRLENTNISDIGVVALRELTNLDELDLGMTRVTEQSLGFLIDLRIHRRLVVPSKWSSAAVVSLQRKSPSTCEVSVSAHRIEERVMAKARR